MPSHWTYQAVGEDDDLAQGDLLEPTDALRAVFGEVHSHFTDEKYLGFMVLTQTCDLVRRSGRCAARHVALCVIRDLRSVLPHVLSPLCAPAGGKLFDDERRIEARMFLDRLLNQNEQATGLFYLHPDADAGVASDAVAVLRVAISLRSQHYDVMTDARVGRLATEFQAKLGWLIGNLYSRVATTDWSDQGQRNKQKKLVEGFLRDLPDDVIWVRREIIDIAQARGIDLSTLDSDSIKKAVIELTPPAPGDQILSVFQRELLQMIRNVDAETLRRLLGRIRNNPVFTKALKRAARGA
jgi:hypothetical protein